MATPLPYCVACIKWAGAANFGTAEYIGEADDRREAKGDEEGVQQLE